MNITSQKTSGQPVKKKKRDNPWYVATMLLGVRPRSVSEMRKRLFAKGFSEEEVERTVNKLIEFKYLDDRSFAVAVCNSLRGRAVGKRYYMRKLKNYGVDEQLASEVLSEVISPEAELESAVKGAEKKKQQLTRSKVDRKLWFGRIGMFLAQRGFTSDVISAAIERIL